MSVIRTGAASAADRGTSERAVGRQVAAAVVADDLVPLPCAAVKAPPCFNTSQHDTARARASRPVQPAHIAANSRGDSVGLGAARASSQAGTATGVVHAHRHLVSSRPGLGRFGDADLDVIAERVWILRLSLRFCWAPGRRKGVKGKPPRFVHAGVTRPCWRRAEAAERNSALGHTGGPLPSRA